MKNIKIAFFRDFNYATKSIKGKIVEEKFCLDITTRNVYIGTIEVNQNDSTNFNLTCLNWETSLSTSFKFHYSFKHQIPQHYETLLNIEYIPRLESVCTILSCGLIFTFNVYEHTFGKIGEFDEGVSSARWNYSKETLAIITKNGKLHYMNLNFDVTKEIQLETVTSTSEICWRRDDQFLATLITGFSNGKGQGNQILFVFDKTGNVTGKSQTRQNDHFLNCLDWNSKQDLINTIQSNSNQIIHFEKNGLEHGETSLESISQLLKPEKCVEILYNPACQILLIVGNNKIACYTFQNYYWYLKRVIPFHIGISQLKWVREDEVLIILKSQEILFLKLSCEFDVSDDACLAVIDSNQIKFSDLIKKGTIPPPMYHSEIKNQPENDTQKYYFGQLTFHIKQSEVASNEILTSDSKNDLFIYSEETKTLRKINFGHLKNRNNCIVRNILWVEENVLLLCSSSSNSSLLIFFELSDDFTAKHITEFKDENKDYLIDFKYCKSTRKIYLRFSSKKLKCTSFEEIKTGSGLSLEDLEDFKKLEINNFIKWDVMVFGKQKKISVVGIDESNKLYVDEKFLHPSCTDFSGNKDYFVFLAEGTQSILFFMDMRNTIEEHMEDETEKDFKFYRMVEQKCQIVHVGTEKIILQTQRGNFETFFPRTFVYKLVAKKLFQRRYKDAFESILRHRIDPNFVVNNNSQQFIADIKLFLTQLSSEHLCIFLSALSDKKLLPLQHCPKILASTKTAIERKIFVLQKNDTNNTLKVTKEIKSLQKHKKTPKEYLLKLLLKKLVSLNTQKQILPVVTANLVSTPKKITSALKYLSAFKSVDLREKAIRSAIKIEGEQAVYDAALKSYNAQICLAVLNCCNEIDMEEEFPFLERADSLKENEKRVEFNIRLQNYNRALFYLSQSDNSFGNCLLILKKHKLFKLAFKIWGYDKYKEWVQIAYLYAQSLSASNPEISAYIFELSGHKKEALEMYINVGNHIKACHLISSLDDPEEKRKEILKQLSVVLKQHKKYGELAKVLKKLELFEESVEFDMKAKQFLSGYKTIRTQIKESALKQSLMETLKKKATEEAEKIKKEIMRRTLKYSDTVKRLRSIRFLRQNRFIDNALSEEDDETKSVMTGSTVFTWSTVSKFSIVSETDFNNAGKEHLEKERRIGRKSKKIKFGDRRTEKFLVKDISKLIPTETFCGEVQTLCNAMLVFDLGENAYTLKCKLDSFREIVRKEECEGMDYRSCFSLKSVSVDGKGYSETWPEEVYEELDKSKNKGSDEKRIKVGIIHGGKIDVDRIESNKYD